MKKTITLLSILTIIIVGLFAFTACNGEITLESEAEGKEMVLQDVKDFLEDTTKNTNYVFTAYNGETKIVTVTRAEDKVNYNDKQYAFIAEDNSKRTAFVDEEELYIGDNEYYRDTRDSAMLMLKMYTEDAVESMPGSLTYKDKSVVVTKKDGSSTATFELTIEGTYLTKAIKITTSAKAVNGLVTEIIINSEFEGEDPETFKVYFEYGSASITLPDFSNYTEIPYTD